MAVRSREELMTSMNAVLGERTDDEALNFIQDFTDTYDDLSSHTGTYTEEQYNDLDASWRKKYKERFFAGGTSDSDDDMVQPNKRKKEEPKREETITIKDLFTPVTK